MGGNGEQAVEGKGREERKGEEAVEGKGREGGGTWEVVGVCVWVDCVSD